MKKLIINSPIPLYYQLREIIRDRIISGEWGYGTEIPSEIKLCEEYNLSRATVRQALDGLVNEGLIDRRRGIGTFVVYNKVSIDFLAEPSFLVETNNKTPNDYARLLFAGFIHIDGNTREVLRTEEAYLIKRIHYLNKSPIALDSHYIKEEYVHKLPTKEIEKIVINRWVENILGLEIDKNKTKIQSVKLSDYENEIFNFPVLNLGLSVESTIYNKDEPVCHNRRLLRADSCDIKIEFILSNNKYELNTSSVDIINRRTDKPQT